MTTNQEWLFSLTLKEYLEWMESEHYEPKDDVSGYGADFNIAEPNFDNIKAVEMDASRFEAVEMDASRLVAREPDSREKLESDMREWWRVGLPGIQEKAENVINYNEAIKWLDRQEIITLTERHKRERELGEAFDGLTEQVDELTAERDQLKNAINELQKTVLLRETPEQPLESLNTIGRYIHELKTQIRNLVKDLVRVRDERDNLEVNNLQLRTRAGAQAATIDELTAERDNLKELNEYHAHQYELASEDIDRMHAQVDELNATIDKLQKQANELMIR